MKIKRSIKIAKDTVAELEALDCVNSVAVSGSEILVILSDVNNKGNTIAHKGDFLCQFDSGLWQRFGSEAMNRTYKNPATEGGRQWSE